MGIALKTVTIQGFKSIELLEDFQPQKLNVLIGANGAGKSNFVDFFRMLRALADEGFQKFIQDQGDGLFFNGPQFTREIKVHLEFGDNVYEFDLMPTADSGIQISEERVQYTGGQGIGSLRAISSGSRESSLKKQKDTPASFGTGRGVPGYVYEAVSNWTVYHFHDTSKLAPMRRDQALRDYEHLRHDAANIAAYLYHLKKHRPNTYGLVRDTIRLVAPYFDDFRLRPQKQVPQEKIRLEWTQKGSDFPFQPYHLSDGSIRFICLVTALIQPRLPATIVIDEPELGLHPYAISVLADLIKSASERTQIIISTQSPTLLDYFEPQDVVVVNRVKGRSIFNRLDKAGLQKWLDEYSVGELWQKNVLRGGPSHD